MHKHNIIYTNMHIPTLEIASPQNNIPAFYDKTLGNFHLCTYIVAKAGVNV
jgi:hypothetical protein